MVADGTAATALALAPVDATLAQPTAATFGAHATQLVMLAVGLAIAEAACVLLGAMVADSLSAALGALGPLVSAWANTRAGALGTVVRGDAVFALDHGVG